MDWRSLESEFEAQGRIGDWDAKWCFDPSTRSRQRWELVGTGSFAESTTFGQMLTESGRLLKQATQGQRGVIPEKLFSGETRMAEAWLNALRHLRINVHQNQQPWGSRKDEGQILSVAHASAQLCIRLRVHRSVPVRSAQSDAELESDAGSAGNVMNFSAQPAPI